MRFQRTVLASGWILAPIAYMIGASASDTVHLIFLEPQRLQGNAWASALMMCLLMGGLLSAQGTLMSLCSFPIKYYYTRRRDAQKVRIHNWGDRGGVQVLVLLAMVAWFNLGLLAFIRVDIRSVCMIVTILPAVLQFFDTFDPRFEASPGR